MNGFIEISIAIIIIYIAKKLIKRKGVGIIRKRENEYTYKIEPSETDEFSFAQFNIFCPPDIKRYKGALYLGEGYEQSSHYMIKQNRWLEMAKRHQLVIITSQMTSKSRSDISYWQAEHGAGQALLEALSQCSKESNHPEIEKLPLIMWGFSAGGQFNYHFACWKPERVIAFVSVKGGYYYSEAREDTLKVPALWFTGEFDLERRQDAVNDIFEKYSNEDYLWCLANEANSGHKIGKTYDLAIPWMEVIIKERLQNEEDADSVLLKEIDSAKGWIGDLSTKTIAKYEEVTNINGKHVWLPNEDIADRWQAFNQ